MTETPSSFRIWMLEEDGKHLEVYVCAPLFDSGTLATAGYTVANQIELGFGVTGTRSVYSLRLALRKTGGSEQPASQPSDIPQVNVDNDDSYKSAAQQLVGGHAVGNDGEAIEQLCAKLKAIFTPLVECASRRDTPAELRMSELVRRILGIISAATI